MTAELISLDTEAPKYMRPKHPKLKKKYNPATNQKKVRQDRNWREPSKWDKHHFIVWDGEGYDVKGRHEYIYLCAYDGQEHKEMLRPQGIRTQEAFTFLVETARIYRYGIHVVYGASYDSNMLLRDVDVETLRKLHTDGHAEWRHWSIRYAARKYLYIQDTGTGKGIMLWDSIGFFQMSFMDALQTWLGVLDKDIKRGKAKRSTFKEKNLDFIIKYCKRELVLFEQLMQQLWESLNSAGIKLNRWDGAGAVAAGYLSKFQIKSFSGDREWQISRSEYTIARHGYSGGRIELFRPGDHQRPIYVYDINSAYPTAIADLPQFSGIERCSRSDCRDIVRNAIYHIHYRHTSWGGIGRCQIGPFAHRNKLGSIMYPPEVENWVWGPEMQVAMSDPVIAASTEILEHYHIVTDGSKPFWWVPEIYRERRRRKDAIPYDPSEKAMKLGLNSLYGKLAQQKGWHAEEPSVIPTWHNLYWAGLVTSATRAEILRAILQRPNAIIACETDSVFSTEPLDLSLGDGLGEWGLKTYTSLTYVQSGMYFATDGDGVELARYRGLDKGTLTREKVYAAYASGKTISAKSTRFRTVGTSLASKQRFREWRQWIQEDRSISYHPTGKRIRAITPDNQGFGMGVGVSIITWPFEPDNYVSAPYSVKWCGATKERAEFEEQIEDEWECILGEN